MSDSNYFYQSVSPSPSSQSVPLSFSHSLPTSPSSSLPFHNISSVSSIAFDIQHLKPFTITSGEMLCHAVMIHIDYFFSMARQPYMGLSLLVSSRSHDHTHLRHTTVGRTPLDEGSARRRDLYLTSHNTHKIQTSMSPVGFEPTILVSERPKTHALDRAATGIGTLTK